MKLKSVGSLISLTINLDLIKEQKIKYLKYGATHLVFVTNYGDVFVYGNNSEGQIGLGEVENVTEIVKIKNINFGEIKFSECHDEGQLGLQRKIEICKTFKKINVNFKVKNVKCGFFHTILLDFNDNIYVTGFNYYGQLGLGNYW